MVYAKYAGTELKMANAEYVLLKVRASASRVTSIALEHAQIAAGAGDRPVRHPLVCRCAWPGK